MKSLLSKISGEHGTKAKVVDGTLILSAPDAISPVVWRWDLGQVASSALEIKEGKDNDFILSLKTPKGVVCDVAPFDSRSKALAALMAVSKAMESAQGQIRPANSYQKPDLGEQPATAPASRVVHVPRKSTNEAIQWFIAVVGVLAVIGMFFYLSTLSPDTSVSYGSSTSTSSKVAPKDATGVPVSADDFLSGM